MKNKGFTLMELVVATAMIAILSSIVFWNFRAGDRSLSLQRSAQLTTQAVATTLNHTLSGRLHDGTVSAGGYGIYFEEGSDVITIFADCNRNAEFDATGPESDCEDANPDVTPDTEYPEEIEQIELETDITVNSIDPSTGSPAHLAVTFLPPTPRAQFTPALTGSEAEIVLMRTTGESITIYINELGVTRIE